MQIHSNVFRYSQFLVRECVERVEVMFRFNRKIYTIDTYEIINRYQI